MTSTALPNFSVVPASQNDRSTVLNLLQLYLYDMASMQPFPLNSGGKYEYDLLDRFWDHPYLFYADKALAGFALVTSKCQITQKNPCWFMAEFFVLRPYRQKGLGKHVLSEILKNHAGLWHIANQKDNIVANTFWSRCLPDAATPSAIRFDDCDWTLRSFTAS